jgi:hypothetical protein
MAAAGSAVQSPNMQALAERFLKNAYELKSLLSKLPLKHLIIYGSDKIEIQKEITRLKKRSVEALSSQDPSSPYKLTPLIVAVLTGRHDVMEMLLKEGADPKVPDHMGLRALHHAALLSDDVALERLLKNDPNSDQMKTRFEGTYKDIQNLTSKPKTSKKANIYVRLFKKDEEKVSAKKYKELTERCYADKMYASPEEFFKFWIKQAHVPENADHMSVLVNRSWSELFSDKSQENPCALVFPSCCSIARGETSPRVVARTVIPEKSSFLAYFGEIKPSSLDPSKIDSIIPGSLAHFIQDGFPNCVLLQHFENGFPVPTAVSLKEIERGETIYANLNDSSIKLNMPCPVRNKKGLLELVSNDQNFEPLWNEKPFEGKKAQKTKDVTAANNFSLNHMQLMAGLRYLVSTPSAQLYLISKDKLPLELFEKLLKALADLDLPPGSINIAKEILELQKSMKNFEDEVDRKFDTDSRNEDAGERKAAYATYMANRVLLSDTLSAIGKRAEKYSMRSLIFVISTLRRVFQTGMTREIWDKFFDGIDNMFTITEKVAKLHLCGPELKTKGLIIAQEIIDDLQKPEHMRWYTATPQKLIYLQQLLAEFIQLTDEELISYDLLLKISKITNFIKEVT